MVMHQEPEIETTRDKLLACAEKSILQKGFAATSIEELVNSVGITKSGFFYHFRDKGELATALLDRYLENEEQWFDGMFRRADGSHFWVMHPRSTRKKLKCVIDTSVIFPRARVTLVLTNSRFTD